MTLYYNKWNLTSLRFRSVLQHAHQPREYNRKQCEDATHEQADRADGRRGVIKVMYKNEAKKQQHHHGQEGEDGADAAGHKRNLFACLAAVAALLGGLGTRRWTCLLVGVSRPRRVVFSEPDRFSHCRAVTEVMNPILRYRGSVATHGAADSPSSTFLGVQSFQTLLAEGVGTVQHFGSVTLQVEVVEAYFAVVLLTGRRFAQVCRNCATVTVCMDILRHFLAKLTTKTLDFDAAIGFLQHSECLRKQRRSAANHIRGKQPRIPTPV